MVPRITAAANALLKLVLHLNEESKFCALFFKAKLFDTGRQSLIIYIVPLILLEIFHFISIRHGLYFSLTDQVTIIVVFFLRVFYITNNFFPVCSESTTASTLVA